jgi:peptide/nickel transport system substrate-binding protein
MQHRLFLLISMLMCTIGLLQNSQAQSAPSGELVYAMHVTLSPSWFDPAETPAQITPFGILYALHDAVVRPLPGERMGSALAESWSESPDGLTYEFKLRSGLKFHNGDPCTAEDVVFSFTRYKGVGAAELKSKVKNVEVVDARTVRFHLHQPWPDFMTFYGTTATAAGVVVPKRYLEQVGEDGFKQHPIGMGPYKFVSHTPGIELVLDANEAYWRHPPYIKRIIIKGVPEGTTRLAMLKRGEADIAFALEGEVAEEVKRDPKLQLVDTRHASIQWLDFAEQWNPKSPWHDKRVRLAANYAIDRQAINEAACLGFCPPTAVIIPRVMDFALQTEPLPYDPKKAKELLKEAGYANGFEAGDLAPIPPFYIVGESVVNYLNAVGIRVKMRTMERAAFFTATREKKLQGLILNASGALGNAATRIETYVLSTGAYAYGGYADIDELFRQQSGERDRSKREALLHQIQRLMYERVMHAPIYEPATLHGVGPRVEEAGVGLNALLYFTSPYEDMRLKRP